jgi:hypothetical protein
MLFGQSVIANQPVVLNPGLEGSLNALLDGPSGLGVGPNGDLYIANSAGNNVVGISYQASPLLAQRPLRIANTDLVGSAGIPIALATTGGSGVIAPSYRVTGEWCSVQANQVVASRPGSCVVTARNPANGRYAETSTPALTFRFLPAQPALTVANTTLTALAGSPIKLVASGGTRSLAAYFLASGDHCVVSAGVLKTTIPTTCVVRAGKVTDGIYGPALSPPKTFTFSARQQSALKISNRSTVGVVGVALTVITSGGSGSGAVSFIVSGHGCFMNGPQLTMAMSGSCVVQASRAASGTFDSARSAPVSFFFLQAKK